MPPVQVSQAHSWNCSRSAGARHSQLVWEPLPEKLWRNKWNSIFRKGKKYTANKASHWEAFPSIWWYFTQHASYMFKYAKSARLNSFFTHCAVKRSPTASTASLHFGFKPKSMYAAEIGPTKPRVQHHVQRRSHEEPESAEEKHRDTWSRQSIKPSSQGTSNPYAISVYLDHVTWQSALPWSVTSAHATNIKPWALTFRKGDMSNPY